MRLTALLFSLLFAAPTALADCAGDAEALRGCFYQWQKSFVWNTPTKPSSMVGPEVRQLVSYARLESSQLYRSGLVIRSCAQMGEKFITQCEGSYPDLVQTVNEELRPLAKQMIVSQEEGRAPIIEKLAQANLQLNERRYALTCHMRSYRQGGFQICFVIDRSLAESEFIQGDAIDDLPLTVGVTRSCTFFVDAQSRMISADHCPKNHMDKAFIFDRESHEVRGIAAARLGFVASHFQFGPPMEDLAVFLPATDDKEGHTLKPVSAGKKFFYLTWDRLLVKGCELRPNDILACATNALRELSGRRAEMLSFPGTYYDGADGLWRRKDPVSVLRTRGIVTFDPNYQRFFFNAYAQRGASGAPLYFPAGTSIAGLLLDRPVVLGPLTGVSGSEGKIETGLTDNLGVVAVLRYERVRFALGTQLQMATDTQEQGPAAR
ncbi:MAG: hypothetical protein KF799_03490 [Bdellovibrionales bacterium]|nr:hypothetical protein [Bdellovibrionales bacterium]